MSDPAPISVIVTVETTAVVAVEPCTLTTTSDGWKLRMLVRDTGTQDVFDDLMHDETVASIMMISAARLYITASRLRLDSISKYGTGVNEFSAKGAGRLFERPLHPGEYDTTAYANSSATYAGRLADARADAARRHTNSRGTASSDDDIDTSVRAPSPIPVQVTVRGASVIAAEPPTLTLRSTGWALRILTRDPETQLLLYKPTLSGATVNILLRGDGWLHETTGRVTRQSAGYERYEITGKEKLAIPLPPSPAVTRSRKPPPTEMPARFRAQVPPPSPRSSAPRQKPTSIVVDVHFLALHEPYQSPGHPVPINATIVHAKTLLHAALPQPDAALIYRCLTEFPDRRPGCVVPLSTLTHELDGGAGWSQVGDWEAVVNGLVRLTRKRECDGIPLGLPTIAATLLGHGPTTRHTIHYVDAPPEVVGTDERQHQLEELTKTVRHYVARGPFWPGDNLIAPPIEPASLPYHPSPLGWR